jgi:fused signal recognition particle receptor
MFGLLKKKFSQLVENISKKTKEKEEVKQVEIQKIEEQKPTIEIEKIEPQIEKIEIKEETKVEEIPERIVGEIEKEVVKKDIIEELKEEKITEVPKSEIEKVAEEVAEPLEKPQIKEVDEIIEKKSWFGKIKEKFVKTVIEKKLEENDLNPILDSLEKDLIEADASYEVAGKIKNDLKTNLIGKEIKRGKEKEMVSQILKQSILDILSVPRIDIEEIIKGAKSENRPAVILFFGMNGVGKSLNLSKLAKWLKDKGHRPILAAGDTYRAAGDLQLEMYAEKINVSVIRHQTGADSCAVIFDARKAAEARGNDVVLGDTSGRMHTKKDLMDELEKIVRVNKPDLKILVLDSMSGSDVVSQFEFFDKAIKVDGVVFSKVDVNEKGGNVLSICYGFKRPILFLGTGQDYENLMEYSPESLVNKMLS